MVGVKRSASSLTSPQSTPQQRRKVHIRTSPYLRRPTFTSTPNLNRRPLLMCPRKRKSKIIDSAIDALKNSKYVTAFRHILSIGKVAQKAFDEVVSERAFLQMRSYVQKEAGHNGYPQFVSAREVEQFSWSSMLSKMSPHLPTLLCAINGSLKKRRYQKTNQETRQDQQLLSLLAEIWYFCVLGFKKCCACPSLYSCFSE